jgi:hypothetical protein
MLFDEVCEALFGDADYSNSAVERAWAFYWLTVDLEPIPAEMRVKMLHLAASASFDRQTLNFSDAKAILAPLQP